MILISRCDFVAHTSSDYEISSDQDFEVAPQQPAKPTSSTHWISTYGNRSAIWESGCKEPDCDNEGVFITADNLRFCTTHADFAEEVD